jgi:murein DD-endopeptidase MepM/ murein hydrolase activator NlpD
LFEITRTSQGKKIKRILCGFLFSLLLSIGYYALYIQYFDTPHSLSIRRSNADLLVKYDLLNKRFEDANAFLTQIQLRDNNVYRATFGLDIIPSSVRDAGFGGIDRYAHLEKSDYAPILMSTSRQLDILLKKACIQSISFDTIAKLAAIAEQMTYCIPAIQPVAIGNGVRISDGFRMRTHPILGYKRFHYGMDLSGPVGTPVFATGNGVVRRASHSLFGFGNCIIIDHGFGYQTLYAHLRSMTVQEGQTVKRGEQIASLGNTGLSKGPHLHYEVHYRGVQQNPINYFSTEMDIDEYEKILMTAQENKEFD